MYCGQCGKKVMENMLFCPFCGSPIVIPDQDMPEAETVSAEAPVQPEKTRMPEAEDIPDSQPVQMEPEGPVSLFDDMPPAETPGKAPDFVPLSFSFDEQLAQTRQAEPEPVPEDIAEGEPELEPESKTEQEPEAEQPEIPVEDLFEVKKDPVPRLERRRNPNRGRRDGSRPDGGQRRSAKSYIPVKEIDMDDIFLNSRDEDDYDVEEDEPVRGRYRDEFDFEEPETGSFFQRHIRGIVSLILLLILAAVCAVWAFSPKGQIALAKVNLAWTAKPYSDLGYAAYQSDQDLMAAKYYEKAYAREPSNYEYAHSAMVAYYEAREIDSAAAMLKKCIEMAPDNPEPYQEMLVLYDDAQTRPWEITELIRLGYQRTGHESLKLD